jgi:RNA ligase (TIGR02306 family)
MAFFGITLEQISEINPHPNADRLSLAKMKGLSFQFVIGKDSFKVGDTVLYFPIDSLLPLDLVEKLGMTGKFSGKDKNKIKTVKLRGEISQGFVCPPEKLLGDLKFNSSEEITQFLGVSKYEPPVLLSKNGDLVQLPSGFSKYDIEGADRYGHIIDLLMDEDVVIMEKMEGTNLSACNTEEGTVSVNQRTHGIKEKDGEENTYWKAARDTQLISALKSLPNLSGIYGELCGPKIQGNMYQLKKHEIFVFDIMKAGKWLEWADFKAFVDSHNLKTAPILFEGKLRDFLNNKSVQEMSNGQSQIMNVLREGIVIKPIKESYHKDIGRLIIKQRSPQYLSETDN